jgi:hypothetical protein
MSDWIAVTVLALVPQVSLPSLVSRGTTDFSCVLLTSMLDVLRSCPRIVDLMMKT